MQSAFCIVCYAETGSGNVNGFLSFVNSEWITENGFISQAEKTLPFFGGK